MPRDPGLLLAGNTPGTTPDGGDPARDTARAAERARALDAHFRQRAGTELLDHVLSGAEGRVALVSSFGAEAALLLHMVAVRAPATPVLFLETGFHFAETLTYQMELTERFGLTDVRLLRARGNPPHPADGTEACCAARKVVPLDAALAEFDGWITGRKRIHGGQRTTLPHVEADGPRLKVNPLAHWRAEDVRDYFEENRLPRHPLVARGYASVGCAPCTVPATTRADGRWAGQAKTECGIHLPRQQG